MPSSSKAYVNGDEKHLVCVTGAGSFIGSWVVKELLDRGYHVRGTARDPSDQKNAHLLALDGAEERLTLYRADVLDYGSLSAAFSGCRGVFHAARAQDSMVVAVEGTRNAINAAADMGVRRMVFTSSYGAVHMDPNRSPDTVVDETCWSDYDFCKRTGNLYCCGKMMAEIAATEEAAKRGLELVVVVLAITVGPMLSTRRSTTAATTSPASSPAKSGSTRTPSPPTSTSATSPRALALVYERGGGGGGHRYLCLSAVLHRAQFVQLLRDLFPHYPVTAKYQDQGDGNPMVKPYKFSNRMLKDLVMEFTPMRESLYDTVMMLQQKGHVTVPALPMPKRARL
ncbi:hypothetical protein ACQ4PT_022803 [Festuca glaucescens]